MLPNPLVELARDPVGFITALGYVCLLLGLLVFGIPHAVRILVEDVYLDWRQNRNREKWARLYGEGPGYLPPFGVGLRALWAFVVFALSFQAIAALLWFAGV